MTCAVGDWVRFYKGGELVLAVVEYRIEQRGNYGAFELCTTEGRIPEEVVLECRNGRDGLKAIA